MSFLDRLRGRGQESAAAKPGAEKLPESLRLWVDELFKRFQPDRLRFQPGETLGAVFSRLVSEEEQRIRASSEDAETKRLKLETLASLTRDLGLQIGASSGAPTAGAGSGPAPEPKELTVSADNEFRPREATFELAMGNKDDLKDAPLGNFIGVLELWSQVVEALGRAGKVGEKFLKEYARVGITLETGEQGTELVAWFRGSKEMIEVFRQKLQ